MIHLKKFQVLLRPVEEGGYTVWCPDLPGCFSQGQTRKQAIENIKKAISLFLQRRDDRIRNPSMHAQVLTVTIRRPQEDQAHSLRIRTRMANSKINKHDKDLRRIRSMLVRECRCLGPKYLKRLSKENARLIKEWELEERMGNSLIPDLDTKK